jgi:hypothetical protein
MLMMLDLIKEKNKVRPIQINVLWEFFMKVHRYQIEVMFSMLIILGLRMKFDNISVLQHEPNMQGSLQNKPSLPNPIRPPPLLA